VGGVVAVLVERATKGAAQVSRAAFGKWAGTLCDCGEQRRGDDCKPLSSEAFAKWTQGDRTLRAEVLERAGLKRFD